jgi:hypothetical protein
LLQVKVQNPGRNAGIKSGIPGCLLLPENPIVVVKNRGITSLKTSLCIPLFFCSTIVPSILQGFLFTNSPLNNDRKQGEINHIQGIIYQKKQV